MGDKKFRIIFSSIFLCFLLLFFLTFINGDIYLNLTNSTVNANLTIENNFTHLNLTDGSLVLYLPFDVSGDSARKTYDYSNKSNDGTVFGAIFSLAGKYGGAYNFSGKENITVANSASLNITDNITISLWAKKNNVSVKQVSAGQLHTCILTEKGDAYCWGYNGNGELGTGDNTNSIFPKLVLGGHNFSSIVVGAAYSSRVDIGGPTCALNTTGSAFCWGYNYYGALGNGNTTSMNTPQRVLGRITFKSISAGTNFFCGLNTSGSAYCWGQNNDGGQLGIGNTTNMPTPQRVLGGYNFTSISLGFHHACALNTTDRLYCWGQNAYGALGIGNTTSPMPTPQRVLGDINFKSVSGGFHHTCAINQSGGTYCWGGNDQEELGIGAGNTTQMKIPTRVVGGYNFSLISTKFSHTCALNTTGSAFCWGYNDFGQLGTTGDIFHIGVPQLVAGGKNFTSLSAGVFYTCGKANYNKVYCWGYNSHGQLGTGFTDALSPMPIVKGNNFNFKSISTGTRHTCAINKSGSAFCWGYNNFGQLGIGNTTFMPTPQLVLGGQNFTSISAGYYHTCAINTTGSAYCWGYGASGQLGTGNTATRYSPQLVLGKIAFKSISGAYDFTCAINKSGSAFCWGYNGYGELGNGNTTDMYTPALVLGRYNFSYISSKGGDHTCALNNTGDAYCWGYNGYGELGNGNTTSMNIPQRVLGGNKFNIISEGFLHTCAINKSGSAFCWGYNSNAQLGIGNTTNMLTPQRVLGGNNFSTISLGVEYMTHTCGINTTGSAYCWGFNVIGELGNGNISEMSVPQRVLGGNNFSTISLGLMHTCALNNTGYAYCWGTNTEGQLGNGKRGVFTPYYESIKSILIGKSSNSFVIAETFSGKIVGILNQNYFELGDLSSLWKNIILIYNQTARGYLNGMLINTSSYIPLNLDNSNLVIGANFDGSIDEIMIFNRALSTIEISRIYNSTYSRFYPVGEMFFPNLNFSTSNTVNISIPNCQQINGSSLKFKINNGGYSQLNSSCMFDNYVFSGNLTHANLTLQLNSTNFNYYSPLIVGNITLKNYSGGGSVKLNIAKNPTLVHNDYSIGAEYWDYAYDAGVEDGYYATASNVFGEGDYAYDYSVRLVKGGTITGDDNRYYYELPTSSPDEITYGGEDYLWGESWTVSDINSMNFGVVYAVQGTEYSGEGSTSYYLKATNFGFNIPVGSTINGIEVKVIAMQDLDYQEAKVDQIEIVVYYTTE